MIEMNFLTVYGGKILSFVIVALSLAMAQAMALNINPTAIAWITFGVALLKAAESVFVPDSAKVTARVALKKGA
ncbi:MAG: hypothetical protein KGL39_28180 [Patescibacteria group bacterium]|nr:hypothetical protein [Patescibacteria group bacterium]